MSESVRDYVTTYSFNKLEETAKTFRRLGEVYENAAEFKTADPGISRQLLLVADVLDECVTTHLYSEEIPKDIAKELFRKCFLSGVRIKNLSTIRNHHGAAELVMQARTVGRGCVSVKKICQSYPKYSGLAIIFRVQTGQLFMNNLSSLYLYRRADSACLRELHAAAKDAVNLMGIIFLFQDLIVEKQPRR